MHPIQGYLKVTYLSIKYRTQWPLELLVLKCRLLKHSLAASANIIIVVINAVTMKLL